MPDLQLVLVTPEKTLLDEPVAALRFPLYDGQIGIMPGRAPMVGRLGYGELKIKSAAGEQSFYIDGGFVQVKGPTVSLLTNRAIPAGKIDRGEAERLLEEAAKKPGRTDVERVIKERDLERGRRMLAMS
jgi:F-type H+-transporting ATPase subunit epsilon